MFISRCDLHRDCVLIRETKFSASALHLDYDSTLRTLADLKSIERSIARSRAVDRGRALHQQRAEVTP